MMADWKFMGVYTTLSIGMAWFHWMDRRGHATERYREKVLDALARIREELTLARRYGRLGI